MSTYITGVNLNQVPTGFGSYTGVVITNSGNFPVQYKINISKTTFDSTVTPSTAEDGNLYDTIFISDSFKYLDSTQNQITKIVNCNESGTFYILHTPFRTFNLPIDRSEGQEYATVTIQSMSSIGDIDNNLIINITGNRITGFPIPQKLGKFYAVKDYDLIDDLSNTRSPSLSFYWSCINKLDYFTGFKLELADNSSFTSPQIDYLSVKENKDGNFPLYGNYDGFFEENYSIKKINLSFGQNYYARIQALNVTGGTGAYTYATGFNYNYPILDGITYSGDHPSPGENLKIDPTILTLNYISNGETDFDLFKFLYTQNNNSADFRKYSGINVKFSPSDNSVGTAIYKSSSISNGAINFVPTNNVPIAFSTGLGGIFRLELEFENVNLYGKGGEGATYNGDGTFSKPQNGGPVFKFDDIKYYDSSDPTNIRKIQYYIYKDVDSIFYAGVGGGAGLFITDQTNKGSQIVVDGSKIETINYLNLKNP